VLAVLLPAVMKVERIIIMVGIAMLAYVFVSMAVPFGRSLLEMKVEGPRVEMTSVQGLPVPSFSAGGFPGNPEDSRGMHSGILIALRLLKIQI